jgi:histidinol-phosphate phosphatase family protein
MNSSQARGNLKKAIFFDRDGTLIVDKVYLNDPDAIEYLPNVFEALRALRDAGFQFFIATNQSGVPRGHVTIENLNEIHRRMRAEFAKHGVDLVDFYYAPYLTDHDHMYRKPNPGMLLQAALEYNIDLGESWMIGDRMTDVEAGRRAGTRTIWLQSNCESPSAKKEFNNSGFAKPDGCFASVFDAVNFIIETSTRVKSPT